VRRPAVPLLLLLLACGEHPGRGEVFGSLVVPSCSDGEPARFVCSEEAAAETCDAFRMDVDFFALEVSDEAAVLRLQHGGRAFAQTDGVLFQIRDVRRLRGNLGARLPVGPDKNIRGALGLFETCPDSTQNFELRGEIVFEQFGVAKGDQVAGTIHDVEVRDGRGDGPGQVLGVLQGSFDFTQRRGPPYQLFAEH
jgi:hypothetical protein